MAGHQYLPEILSPDERPFRNVLDQLVCIFGSKYQIWFQSEDFSRIISAGVFNSKSQVGVKICLKYGGVTIANPINPIVIQRIYHHFISTSTEDLALNFPSISSVA